MGLIEELYGENLLGVAPFQDMAALGADVFLIWRGF